MCCIQREIGTVSQHGGRACIFNGNVPYVGEKTGNEELITMLVCRDTDCFHGRLESSVLLWKKSSDIGRTEPMAHGSSKSRHWLIYFISLQLYRVNKCIQRYNEDWKPTSRAALMPSKPDSAPLFCFFPQWCDALLTRCPPCHHQPALARLMRRLQGAQAPQLLLGGWAQRSGPLPRVLPSAEAESSRRDFAAEVERNESGGRARCWEMEAAPALHPSKAWCSLPAMTSRQLRLAGLGESQRTQVALGFCLDIKPSWSVQVLKVSPTRRR